MEVDTSVVELLRENTEEVRKEACDILVKLLSNVITEPSNTKYRQVKLANKKIEEKLLPACGAFEILFSVGFEEAEDKLVLPLNANIKTIEKFRDAIKNMDDKTEGAIAAQSAASLLPVTSPSVAPSSSVALLHPGVLTREREFLNKLVNCLAHTESYEDKTAQVSDPVY